MKRGIHRIQFASLLLAILAPPSLLANDLAQQATALLEKRCHMCHGAAMQTSKLDEALAKLAVENKALNDQLSVF